jgi:beta-1,4-N-acetylglucosaminyltransferase
VHRNYLKKKHIVGVCSGGGHLTELLAILKHIPEVEEVITETEVAERNKSETVRFLPLVDPHRSVLLYLKNIACSIYLALKVRPDVVISTGAGMTVPFFLMCRLLGSTCIWIESGARIKTPAKSSKFSYKFAHLFVSQSSELKKFFPDSHVQSIIPPVAKP